jgi:hypothetical protein
MTRRRRPRGSAPRTQAGVGPAPARLGSRGRSPLAFFEEAGGRVQCPLHCTVCQAPRPPLSRWCNARALHPTACCGGTAWGGERAFTPGRVDFMAGGSRYALTCGPMAIAPPAKRHFAARHNAGWGGFGPAVGMKNTAYSMAWLGPPGRRPGAGMAFGMGVPGFVNAQINVR